MLQRLDLKIQLLLAMVLLSAVCFALSSFYVLLESGQRARAHATWMAETAAKDLEFQMQRASWIARPAIAPPDLQLVASLVGVPGACIAFRDGPTDRQRFCSGVERLGSTPPRIFARLYRLVLQPDRPILHSVALDGRMVGEVSVQLDPATQIEQAWRDTSHVLAILAITLTALCGLLYAAFHRILAPTSVIPRACSASPPTSFRRACRPSISANSPPSATSSTSSRQICRPRYRNATRSCAGC